MKKTGDATLSFPQSTEKLKCVFLTSLIVSAMVLHLILIQYPTVGWYARLIELPIITVKNAAADIQSSRFTFRGSCIAIFTTACSGLKLKCVYVYTTLDYLATLTFDVCVQNFYIVLRM